MHVDGEALWELLRSLDDPENLEFPAGYDYGATRRRFDRLVARLAAAFSCTVFDRHGVDASFHGRIVLPASAVATRSPIVILVSNFGGLAVVTVDNPGVWTQQEFTELLDPSDAQRIYAALDDLGYTVIPEEPLWSEYDGPGPLRSYYPRPDNPATWWIRFFDYL